MALNITGNNNSKQQSRNFKPAPKGTKPTLVLKVMGQSGKYEIITGLFEGSTRNGDVFYSGKAKDGTKYLVAEAPTKRVVNSEE